MSTHCDVIVLGAGMAGASVSAELAPSRSVVLLEREDQPGRHATGRSAAMYFASYGNPCVRALTRASHAFLAQPPAGFCDVPLLSPRSALFVADLARLDRLTAMACGLSDPANLHQLDARQARGVVPILHPDWIGGGLLDTSGSDIDVAALHQGYLRAARRAGVQLVSGTGEIDISRRAGNWNVRTPSGHFEAPVLVNACGAWADEVARQAGARAIGLQPLRRSALLIAAPPDHDIRHWPLVIDVDETFYFKPDAGQILLSPANEDPSPPCDAVPDEMDIAIAVDRFERATTLQVRKVAHRWAGLRSFVADRSPVVGFDAQAPGFFWLAGQGGYGIQMAPALARVAAAQVCGAPLPPDVVAQGLTMEDIAPSRDALAQAVPHQHPL